MLWTCNWWAGVWPTTACTLCDPLASPPDPCIRGGGASDLQGKEGGGVRKTVREVNSKVRLKLGQKVIKM